jgi:hypothetical protein
MSGNSLIYLDNHLYLLKDIIKTSHTRLGTREIDWDHRTGSNDLRACISGTTLKIKPTTSINNGLQIVNTISSVQNHWQAPRTCTS